MKGKTILEDIRQESFHSLYLLYGEETFLRQAELKKLLAALNPDGDEMNFARFMGKDIDIAQVISLGETMPFFSDRRVVLLEQTGFFKNAKEELIEYLKHMPDYLILIFVEDAVDKRSRLYKAVQTGGLAQEYAYLQPDKLVGWVQANLKHHDKTISAKDARAFVDRIGVDMGLLWNEVEKVLAYTMDRKTVTWEDIEAVCPVHLQDRIFDMLRAITARDQEKALGLYYDLLALKVAPIKILVLLGREYAKLLKACELKGQAFSTAEAAARLGVRPFAVRSTMECASRYSLKEVEKCLDEVVRTDEAIKTGRLQDTYGVEMLIIGFSGG